MRAASPRSVDEAMACWPGLTVGREAFAAYLDDKLRNSDAAADHAGDLYLACALVHGCPHALRAFEQHHLAKVGAMVSRFRLSSDEIDELTQLLRNDLLLGEGTKPGKIADYSGRGPLQAWLRVLAVRAAIKLKKRGQVEVADDERLANMPGVEPDAELAYVGAAERAAFRAAFRAALATLEKKEQTVLKQHFLDGLTLDQLAALHRAHRTTVAYWIERARAKLLKRTRLGLTKGRRLSTSAAASILRRAHAEFASTFSSFFG